MNIFSLSLLSNIALLEAEASKGKFVLFDDVRGVFDSIANAVEEIWMTLTQGVKAFGLLINMIFEALSLPVILNGVVPYVLYTMIAFIIGCSVIKLIFTRGGSR